MTFKEHIENEVKRLSKEWQEDILRDIKNFESEETMEQRLQELKEKITSFVRDYEIESFDIWIDKEVGQKVKVNLEIRV